MRNFLSCFQWNDEKFAAEKGVCYLCLATTHRSKDCPYQNTKCNICGFKHHFLLHPPSNITHTHSRESEAEITHIADTQFNYAFQQTKEPKKALELDVALTYFTAILRNPDTNKAVTVNLLADSGANNNCLDIQLAQELGLKGEKRPFHVQVGGGKINSYWALMAQLEIQGTHQGAKMYPLKFQAYEQPCGQLSSVNWAAEKVHWEHLKNIDLPEAAERPIQGIIGTNNFFLLAPTAPAITMGPEDPIAFMTRLGWMVGGKIRPNLAATHISVHFMHEECCQETKKALDRLWFADNQKEQPNSVTNNLRRGLLHTKRKPKNRFADTRQRLPDGRYQVGLLWKTHAYIPNNYRQALQAFYNLERQMEHQPEMKTQFIKTVKEWLNTKIARYTLPTDPVHYVIPTFLVVRLDKATTSYRLVVDGLGNSKVNA